MFRPRHLNHHPDGYQKVVLFPEVLNMSELVFDTPPNLKEGRHLYNPLQNPRSAPRQNYVVQNLYNLPICIVSMKVTWWSHEEFNLQGCFWVARSQNHGNVRKNIQKKSSNKSNNVT